MLNPLHTAKSTFSSYVIPQIWWNSRVHYCIHNSQSLVTILVNLKGNFTLRHATNAQKDVELCLFSFFNLGTTEGRVVDATPAAIPSPSPGKKPSNNDTGGWVGPRAYLDGCGRSRPTGNQFPDRSARCVVAIPTELFGPPCPYPEPNWVHVLSIKIFKLLQTLPSHPLLALPSCLFPPSFSVYRHVLSPHCVSHVSHVLFPVVWLRQNLLRRTNHEAPYHKVFSSVLSPPHS
jgi:hypothetical protein